MLHDVRAVHRAAPQQRLDPHEQLGEGERLGEIVVRAGLEIRHLVARAHRAP